MKRNFITLSAMLVLSLCLTACFWHKNPLLKTNKNKTAHFLVSASQYGEKQLNVLMPPGGGFYGRCIEGDKFYGALKGQKPAVFCQNLYKQMVKYAQTTKNYKSVTVSDLTDPDTWKLIQYAYKRVRFDTI